MENDENAQRWLGDLHQIWRQRLLEETIWQWRRDERFVASAHLCIGQEAISTGACRALRSDDPVFTTYRGHGWALTKGVPAEAILAEVLGRETGTNGGRGGSAMLSSVRHGFYGENAIVGGHLPIASGAALAIRERHEDRAVLVVLGDGAMNQGATHEAMNFAAYQKLPLVIVCENNTYSELTRIDSMVGNPRLFERAGGYGFPGLRIDGNDTDVVYDTVHTAVERARAGEGPTLIEAMTERLVGHYIGDAQLYRPRGEVDDAKTREPVVILTNRLREIGISEDEIATREDWARVEIDSAAERALSAPPADTSTVKEHLYA